jgi:signal transduction histidine kinase
VKAPRSAWPATLGVTLLAGLLAVLGTLQYRWITEVSTAERERRGRQLEGAARAFAEELDQELSRLLLFLHPAIASRQAAFGARDAESAIAERFVLWSVSAVRPELVSEVYLAELGPNGGWRRLDAGAGRFEPAEVPVALESLRRRLIDRGRGPVRFVHPRFLASPPSVVAPLAAPMVHRRGSRGRLEAGAPHGTDDLLVVRLDQGVLVDVVLPELAQRHFGDELDVEIRAPDRRGSVLYRTAGAAALSGEPDLVRPLHLLRPFEHLHSVAAGARGPRVLPGRWEAEAVLVVSHREGSLGEVVRQTRRRNLVVSLGVLALLAGSVVMLLVATVRARRLARRQVELVASLTHELHTPLAAIDSAAANLADGVISAPSRVREYGALIGEHARRLGSMVAHALELAGVAGGAGERWEAVDLGDVVRSAQAACEPLCREQGVVVELELEDDLPPVRGRPEALRLVVENLLRNAARHGAAGGMARVRARRADASGAVELVVEDEGPGFDPADLPHVFEAFYRGRSAAGSPGSGLGLRLVAQTVERHGGSVEAHNRPGGGALVVIRLPPGGSPHAG